MGDIVTKGQKHSHSHFSLRKENHFRTCFPFSHLPITKLSYRRNITVVQSGLHKTAPHEQPRYLDLG